MSLCFELSAWGSNVGGTSDYSNKSRNARDLLDQIGFENFETNDYFTVKPSEDSMGVVVAHKDITVDGKKYTLIALATRGGGYEAEWAGNFTIGAMGQHEGFKKATDEAYRFLADYITRHKAKFQTDIKFWFAGYSRGGATVNMLAGRLNDDRSIAGITFDKEKLYAYCFEPPMGALKSQVQPASNYTNIHNIVNPSDPVTKVAPKSWNFTRYSGVDRPRIPSVLTSSNTADFTAMMEKFKLLNTEWVRESVVHDGTGKEKHIIDTFQAKKMPSVNVDIEGHWEQKTGKLGIKYWVWIPHINVDSHWIENDNKVMSAFLDELILSLATGIGGRLNYTVQLQEAARLAAAEFMGGNYESYKWDKAKELFDKKLKDHIFDIAGALIWSGTEGAEVLVLEYLYESISEAGISIYAYGSVPNALAEALRVIARTVVASACLTGGNDLLTLLSSNGNLIDMNGNQVSGMNLFKLLPAHYPELCLAWMQMQDSNYTPEGRALFVINSYRVVRINCPVDVSVFNSSGVLVAQIVNNVPLEIEGSSIVSSFNANGEKVIYLPADDQYDLNIVATEDGELNYSVSEFSYDTGTYAKIVNYYDIPISIGDVFNGVAPQFIGNDTINTGEGSGALYSLSGNMGELTPSFEVTGENAQNSVYAVYAETNNTEGGTVIGGGAFSEGAFAQVTAIAYEKCEFIGWYDNNTLVSTEAEYRFCVENDIVLTAEFTGNRPNPTTTGTYELTIVAGSGGVITTGATGYYSNGSVATLEATPNSGYRFKSWTSSNGGTFADAFKANTAFTMPANSTTITANFEPIVVDPFTITAIAGTGGTVSGGGMFASGTQVILTATPNNNYTFDGWYEGGMRINGANATYKFTVTVNRTIEARFTYSGSGGGGGGGGISYTSATINIKETAFDKSAPKDIVITLSTGSYTFRDINNGDYTLVRDTDYSVNRNTYTIMAAYLVTLDDGKATLTFNMSGGTNPMLTLIIESATPTVSSNDGVLLNGKETELKLNADGSVTITANDISSLSEPILLALPFKDGGNSHTGVLKKGGQDIIISFSVYKDGLMIMLVSEPGTYGVINNEKTFTDTTGHWAANTIDFITTRAIYSGVGNNKFDPNGGMTRAMFAQNFANIEDVTLTAYNTSRFTDVGNDAWYMAAVEWAAANEIVGGYGNNLFGPDDFITREQMAVMLNNYMKYKGIVLKKDDYIPFVDDGNVSSWAKDAVTDIKRYGLITGVGNNTYAPKDTANRASVAQIFKNFIEAYVK